MKTTTNHETRKGETMIRSTYNAIANEIAAIEANPIGWAREAHERFLDTLGSMAMHAQPVSDADLAEKAANELARLKASLPAEAPAEEPAVDWNRRMAANARTRRAIENFDS